LITSRAQLINFNATPTSSQQQGHNCTDYAKWFKSNQPYAVEYHNEYEPWFIIDRFRNPW
jgi:hypothetical protein